MQNMFTKFDITVIQRGDVYTVSGKSAMALYEKLQQIPPEAQTLEVGELKKGGFTLRKLYLDNAASNVAAANEQNAVASGV